MKSLDFPVKKTKGFFLRNYSISDKAAQRGDELLKSEGLETIPFGEDRRYEKVWEAGKDKPDRIIRKDGRDIALLDWKGKKKDDWMINERAYNSYLEWGAKLGLPVYVAIWSEASDDGKFIKLPAKSLTKKTMWHDLNPVVVFSTEEMKGWKDLPDELRSL